MGMIIYMYGNEKKSCYNTGLVNPNHQAKLRVRNVYFLQYLSMTSIFLNSFQNIIH